MMKLFMKKIQNLIKRGVVSLSSADNKRFPVTQVSYMGKTSTIEIIQPYGLFHRLPEDALVLMFSVQGNEDNKAGIGSTPTKRFKNLAEGEVAVGNPLTGSVVYFRENGDIEVIGENDMSITLDGDMNITSDVNITGNVTISGEATIGGIPFSTHVHSTSTDPSGVPT